MEWRLTEQYMCKNLVQTLAVVNTYIVETKLVSLSESLFSM